MFSYGDLIKIRLIKKLIRETSSKIHEQGGNQEQITTRSKMMLYQIVKQWHTTIIFLFKLSLLKTSSFNYSFLDKSTNSEIYVLTYSLGYFIKNLLKAIILWLKIEGIASATSITGILLLLLQNRQIHQNCLHLATRKK